MPALGADVETRRKLFVVDRLRAAGALDPQAFGHAAGLFFRRRDRLAGLLEPGH